MTQKPLPQPEVTYKDVADLIKEGVQYQEELKDLLSAVTVPVKAHNHNVIEAIKNVFGEEYIDKDGNSRVTFDMVLECMKLTRSVGKAAAGELK